MGKGKKNNDRWSELNNLTKYVNGKKVEMKKTKHHFALTIMILVMTFFTFSSVFLLSGVLQNAFNIGNFKFNLPEESIVVDMNKVPIIESEKSLRLNYFQDEVKTQVFALATKQDYWSTFLSTDINKYDFYHYDANNSKKEITNSLIQSDGIAELKLQIKLKNSFLRFMIPVFAQIKNTAQFYKKFLMFNKLEGNFSKHISGKNNLTPDYLPEEKYHGYLPTIFNFPNSIDNTIVYQAIRNNINKFINNYSNEFSSNTKLFPILSTIPLGDIDINDETTFEPYFKLVTEPEKYYFGDAVKNDPDEYRNLEIYSTTLPSMLPFYITYVSNPNVVKQLIALQPTTEEELINYLKENLLYYIPFSMVQENENDQDKLIPYVPAHILLTKFNESNSYFKYNELGSFFAFSTSIMNGIEKINSDNYPNIGALVNFLEDKYWREIYTFLHEHKYYFALHYPNNVPPINPEENWHTVTSSSLTTFKEYFINAYDIIESELSTITFLDENHNILPLVSSDLIDTTKIKILRFQVGKNLQTNEEYKKPHSFNFSFKIKWNN